MGGVAKVEIEENNALHIKGIGVLISTSETLPAGQGLLQQLNDVQADFREDIDPHGIEGLTVVALAHMLSFAALCIVSPARAATGYGPGCGALGPCDMRDTFACMHQDNYSASVSCHL